MPAVTLRGVNGSIRWGYHLAATCAKWCVVRKDDGSFTLSASTSQANAYHLTQRPLVFTVSVVGGMLTWPIRSLDVTGSTVTGTLGPLGSTETNQQGVEQT
jgi:hypothetical protein